MNEKILVVEDDVFIADIYKRTLTGASYIVDVAEDGFKAQELMHAQRYDLILLDIMLPKITGIDILKRIRQSDTPDKNTPIILITNLGEESILNEAMTLGANGYILKAQVTPPELIKQIEDFFYKLKSAPTP